MGTIQDGEVHGSDVETGGYIERWTTAAGLNKSTPVVTAPSNGAPRPGWMQTGDVHGDDLDRIVSTAPQWKMT